MSNVQDENKAKERTQALKRRREALLKEMRKEVRAVQAFIEGKPLKPGK
jgi:hypothetical protein